MHLRDQVREDDVDRAIKTMLDSFLYAQKVSVQKVLRRSFRKYLNFGVENNSLIMHQLEVLLREAVLYRQNTDMGSGPLAVLETDLQRKVCARVSVCI